ncbi:hypothetical protein FJZ17_01030 [Candidatus Pacearchaeota archaeon]|nr:hypothetical protein [Candidatus Pacearchaeota archaeon]
MIKNHNSKHLKMKDENYKIAIKVSQAENPGADSNQDRYPKPAPKKDCHCPADAPCRISGRCACDALKDLIKTIEDKK